VEGIVATSEILAIVAGLALVLGFWAIIAALEAHKKIRLQTEALGYLAEIVKKLVESGHTKAVSELSEAERNARLLMRARRHV